MYTPHLGMPRAWPLLAYARQLQVKLLRTTNYEVERVVGALTVQMKKLKFKKVKTGTQDCEQSSSASLSKRDLTVPG